MIIQKLSIFVAFGDEKLWKCAKYTENLWFFIVSIVLQNISATKAQILMKFETHMIVVHYHKNFGDDPCTLTRAGGKNACAHISLHVHAITPCACMDHYKKFCGTSLLSYGWFHLATAKICWYWWKLQYCNRCCFLSLNKNFMKILVHLIWACKDSNFKLES